VSDLRTEAELQALGAALSLGLAPGAVVWLEGPLGAGKTTLARAIVAARGARLPATSPTFNLVHRYEGPRGTVFHVDCYRMRDPEEAAELDWEGMGAGDLLLVEWPDRGGAWVPPPTVRVILAHGDDPDRRQVDLVPSLAVKS
jgi:tRNA threonylcarbamoyl adenosine modification protein YjeE